MKSFILILLVLISCKIFSQENECYTVLGTAQKYPMPSATIYGHLCESVIRDDKNKVMTCSKNSLVFAISSGKVLAISSFDSNNKSTVVVIKDSDNFFYAYYYLNTVYVTKGKQINKGSILGKAEECIDEKSFTLRVAIATKDGNYLNEDKIWEIIKRANNDSSAAVCDATVLN